MRACVRACVRDAPADSQSLSQPSFFLASEPNFPPIGSNGSIHHPRFPSESELGSSPVAVGSYLVSVGSLAGLFARQLASQLVGLAVS